MERLFLRACQAIRLGYHRCMQSAVRRQTSACNILALLALLVFFPIFAFAQPTHPKPESLGFSSERLGRLHDAMQRPVDEKSLAGVVTLLMRHGKFVEQRSYGVKDMASGAPMTNDTIFRIYSMTKPVTGVAMMILYEEGKWHPTDPISKLVPEFAGFESVQRDGCERRDDHRSAGPPANHGGTADPHGRSYLWAIRLDPDRQAIPG